MPIHISTTSYNNPRVLIYGQHILNAPDILTGHVNLVYPLMAVASSIILSLPLAASMTLRYESLMGIMTMCP